MGKRSEQYHEFQRNAVFKGSEQLVLLNRLKRKMKRKKTKRRRKGNIVLRGERGVT